MESDRCFIISVDIGTTTIRSVLYDDKCEEVASFREKVETVYTTVENDEILVEIEPNQLFEMFIRVVKQACDKAPTDVKLHLAICTQRNSIVLWNKKSRIEESRIICWNDKRANKECKKLNDSWTLKMLNTAGAVLHFFTRRNRFIAAQRLKFLGAMVSHRLIVTVERSEKLKKLHKCGELEFGCLETWLLMRCSRDNRLCVEASNISPSGMFDPWINDYNQLLLSIIGFPNDLLLPIIDSNLNDVGKSLKLDGKHCGSEIGISAILADQQSAMYGCGAWNRGDVKITLGTGTFVDVHTGNEPHASMSGLYPVVAWRVNGKPEFCAEGNAHDTAVILEWARSIGLFDDVTATSDIALSVDSTNGTVFVPAFYGIQTPVDDETACSGFLAIRPDTTNAHMIRSVLEAIVFRVYQIYKAASDEVYINTNSPIRICGGVSNNNFICQCIADMLNRDVERVTDSDHVAARGVAMMAGLSRGLWNEDTIKSLIQVSDRFQPNLSSRAQLMKTFAVWEKAVNRCKGFYH